MTVLFSNGEVGMKRSILTLIAAALALGACAESVSSEMAVAAANAWVLRNEKFGAGRAATGKVITVRDTNKAETVLWHQVSMTGDGCVIVAPVTEIEPVVAALDNDPGELPAAHPLRGILRRDMRARLRVLGLYQEDGAARLQSVAPVAPGATDGRSAGVAEWALQQEKKWARLGLGGKAKLLEDETLGRDVVDMEVCVVKGFERNGPLTHWSQGSSGGYLYNYYTPNHSVCGCVATACAAIVQFFGATNAVEYVNRNCTYNNVPCQESPVCNFQPATTKKGEIDWSSFEGLRASAYSRLSDEQREIIGRVAYNAAVGVTMHWTDDESGAIEANIVTALKKVFGFKEARYIDLRDTQQPWNSETYRKLIYGQCAAGAPVGISIESHSVVCVGYGQDYDGVERVRIFMGWGGSGDGWYALPMVDTKATMGGSSYISEVVDGIVTMISWKDSRVVPVVGQVKNNKGEKVADAELTFLNVVDTIEEEIPGEPTGEEAEGEEPAPTIRRTHVLRKLTTTADGWFGTRVPAVPGVYKFTCAGKMAEYEVGEACVKSTNEKTLARELPEWFNPFPLLNSTVCFRFETAVKTALEEGKAILRISGISGETNTQQVLDEIFKQDLENKDDFTNHFVYYFTTSSATNGDVCPSYGVLLPKDSKEESRWYFTNGRLAYGYGRTVTTTNEFTVTNVLDVAKIEDSEEDESSTTNSVPVTNIVTAVGTNLLISTYAPSGSEGVYGLFSLWPEYDATIPDSFKESVDAVIAAGWDEFTKQGSEISWTVRTESGLTAGEVAPAWGTTTGCYTNGQTVVATASFELTNEVVGVVMGVGGYTLSCSNLYSNVVTEQTGSGSEVSYTVSAGDQCTLTWNMVTNYVRITVGTPSPKASAGTTEPGTGWYKYGEDVLFTAKPAERWTVERWNGATEKGLPEGFSAGGPCVLVRAYEPMELNVKFRQQTTAEQKAEGTNYLFKVVSYTLDVDEDGQITGLNEVSDLSTMPKMKIYGGTEETEGTEIVQGEEATLPNAQLALVPSPLTYKDRRGRTWECYIWNFYGYEDDETLAHDAGVIGEAAKGEGFALAAGSGPVVGLTPSQDVKLVLYWVQVEDRDEPVDPPVVKVDIPIDWNEALDNLHSGEVEILSAADAKKLPPNAQITVGEPPLGWKLDGAVKKGKDGSLTATLVLDENVLAPKAVDGAAAPITIVPAEEGKLLVKAEIANGVKGFWYSLFTADELTGPWDVVTSGYESGTPVKQAALKESTGSFSLSILVDPTETKRFYKLVVTEKNPSAE